MNSPVKDAAYWREKYRELLQERGAAGASDDLQRAIEKLARTAALLDQQLSKGLNPVYQQAKRGSWGKPGQLALLEQTLEDYQRQLKLTREREQQAIADLQNSLSEFALDGASKKNLKLATKLFRSQSFANEWAPVLEALSNLKPAEGMAASDQPGLLARLFGAPKAQGEAPKAQASEARDETIAEAELAQEPTEPSAEDVQPEPSAALPTETPAKASPDDAPEHQEATPMGLSGELIEHPSGAPLHEPPFGKISDRISRVLGDLLNQLEPEDAVAEKAEAAKNRIHNGLNWYELVPTLEDIRDLVMALIVNAKQDYQQYLLHLLEQINQMITMAGAAVDAANAVAEGEEQLLIDLDAEVGAFDQALQSMSDMAELKRTIETRVQTLAAVVSRHRKARAAEDGPLAKIKDMEATIAALKKDAEARNAELEAAHKKASTDNLTGLPNRDAYNQRLHHEIERFRRYQRDLTMVVCDIDHFKKFNDDYSHQVGDRVLKVVSNAIQKQLRDVDFMARYGGEEFVVLFPETTAEDGLKKMDRIRTAVAGTKFKFKDQQLSITFSAGLAQVRAGETGSQLFARADQALYKAKDRGRNCCVIDTPKDAT
ncbi:diguanylate cyclase [Simiduia sp. 21SJ11W-1]|uniref:GGDEF domain-containing protein n=1 Tax=Simiduia sp. 21SJ11W-1 TaxID=2909669 RepID=UPI0020A10E7E|nr:diguanylate cyclase [Simiduia sp. 21SJ11W-1]UTA47763.1 diguanylate cyclase [Simiduia sp. 21SJ11W-1]